LANSAFFSFSIRSSSGSYLKGRTVKLLNEYKAKDENHKKRQDKTTKGDEQAIKLDRVQEYFSRCFRWCL
jgi:hypothetical protein